MSDRKPKESLPPSWIRKLLDVFLDSKTLEVCLGDLEEKFQHNLRKHMSRRKVTMLYVWEGLGFIRMAGRRKSQHRNHNPYGMYRSYFKIGWRNLAKDKGYSVLNISGLAIGLAVAMLISIWIFDEMSFNTDNRNYNTVALVNKHRTYNGKTYTETSQSLPLAHELRTVYGSYFENVAIGSWPFEHSVKYGETSILKRGLYMEEGGQQILDLKIISGSLDQTRDPFSILISESVAASLFRDESPLNKVVRIDDKIDVKIAGIYRDFPHGSTFREIGLYGSMEIFETTDAWVKNSKDRWDVNSFPLYVQIAPNTTFDALSSRIKHITFQHTKDDTKPELFLYPMRKWHLYQDFRDGQNIGTGMRYLWSFGCIGIFVLVLACINFMNLSTARYEKRAKEIGIRKAIGSARGQLIAQFYIETFLYVLSAIFLAVIMVNLALPWLNEIANKKIATLLFNPLFWSAIGAFGLVTGILAGSYPAFFLSSFNAVNVLKGKFRATRYSSTPRKVLVVIQFCISLTLIIAAGVIYEQVQFVKNRPLGYEKDGLIYIERRSPNLHAHYEAFKKELLDSRNVVSVSQSSGPVTESWFSSSEFNWQGKDPDYKEDFITLVVSQDFGNTVSWELLQGRNFSEQLATDSSAMIVNESAMKIIGKENLLNETIAWQGNNFQVVGVTKDLLLDSPYESTKPMVFVMRKANLNIINLRLNPTLPAAETIAGVEKAYKKYSTEPFDFRFASALHDLKFRKEDQVVKLSTALSVLAIVISCMGMFGLASFMAEQRTKEIGVRKVLGATLLNLCRLLSVDFVILVMISFVLAVPSAYYVMNNWLQSYEYRTEISSWIFLTTGLGAFVMTLLTVSVQALKAAMVSPVRSLKSE